jgi:hypothetical protein
MNALFDVDLSPSRTANRDIMQKGGQEEDGSCDIDLSSDAGSVVYSFGHSLKR